MTRAVDYRDRTTMGGLWNQKAQSAHGPTRFEQGMTPRLRLLCLQSNGKAFRTARPMTNRT
jgi:hypothetical protein